MSIYKSRWLRDDPEYSFRPPSMRTDPWKCSYPNVADFNFNYNTLLNRAKYSGIAHNDNPSYRIAVVGLGVAGLMSARELLRCGYTNIDLYEATDRIAGSTHSKPVDNQLAVFECGASRIPFLNDKQSVSDYLTQEFGIAHQDFPCAAAGNASTGIYMNQGLGPDLKKPFPDPGLLIWEMLDSASVNAPPSEMLQLIYERWIGFSERFTEVAANLYGTPEWSDFWQAVARHYSPISFHQFAMKPFVTKYDDNTAGFFGGLGLTEQQSELFASIGIGDGGWREFYSMSSMYPLRTLMFGFGNKHQLIQGKFNCIGDFVGGPYEGLPVYDSLGKRFQTPSYLGIQSYAECLMFESVLSINPQVDCRSLYDAVHDDELGVCLFTQTRVQKLQKNPDGSITLSAEDQCKNYDAVILTPPSNPTFSGIELQSFAEEQLPKNIEKWVKHQPSLSSCKVFFSLKSRYWEDCACCIPQVVTTDGFLKEMHAYGFNVQAGNELKKEPGVMVMNCSFDDAAMAYVKGKTHQEIAEFCLKELNRILLSCVNVGQEISQYIDVGTDALVHWYGGNSDAQFGSVLSGHFYTDTYQLAAYNQNYSKFSGLYLSGDAPSMEGGWMESALRTALDSILYVVENSGGKFLNGFDINDIYPRHIDWKIEPFNVALNSQGHVICT